MTQVKFEESNDMISMAMEDHAGDDRVCSACSILAYTLAQEISDLGKSGHVLQCEPIILLEDGKVHITCSPESEYYNDVKSIFITIQTGFRLLNANFPENVSLCSSL